MRQFPTFKEASEYAKELSTAGESVSVKRDGESWTVLSSADTGGAQDVHTSSSIWVGLFESTGAVVVFDASASIAGVDHVCGYVPNRDVMRTFEPQIASKAHVLKGARASSAISSYQAWKPENLPEFLERETEKIERKKRRAVEKHKEYLTKIGKPYSGVVLDTPKRHRVTHCYACKEPLDSSFHIECAECAWLICECGACGCGYGYMT